MVFIKLQYKDTIKKILLAKEDINWDKICQILHQIFKFQDPKLISLLYKDDQDSMSEIEIKCNKVLLETINTKLISKLIKFFVFYSGVLENDGETLYTSLIRKNEEGNLNLQSHKRKYSANIQSKKKSISGILDVSSCYFSQKNKNTDKLSNTISNNIQLLPNRNEIPTIQTDLQNNLIIQAESKQQFKNILSQAISKSNVLVEIKDRITEFINDSSSQTQIQVNKVVAQNQQQNTGEEIEYQIQTKLKQLSDIFIQNIREVVEEQLSHKLDHPLCHENQPNIHKCTEELQDEWSKLSSKELKEINNKKDKKDESLDEQQGNQMLESVTKHMNGGEVSEVQNHSQINMKCLNNSTINNQLLQSSIFTPSFHTSTNPNIKTNKTNSDKILQIMQEQEESITKIEDNLLKTQQVSEEQINQQFEQNFRCMNHLLKSIHKKQDCPDIRNQQQALKVKNKTISAHELYQILDKQVQKYSQSNYSQNHPLETDLLSGQSAFDFLINEQIMLKSQRISYPFERPLKEKQDNQIKHLTESQKQSSASKEKQNEEEQKIIKNQNIQKQQFVSTIETIISPLHNFMNQQLQQKQSNKSILITSTHFNESIIQENKQSSNRNLNNIQDTSTNSFNLINHSSSKEIIYQTYNQDQDFNQELPKLIMQEVTHSIVQNV